MEAVAQGSAAKERREVPVSEVRFTDRELDVMGVLWDRGPSTVSEVRDRLPARLAYTTVLTILRTLEEKGHVAHEKVGRAHRYHPCVDRTRARLSALGRLRRALFSGSAELLVAHLVRDGEVSEEELARIRRLLDGDPPDPDG